MKQETHDIAIEALKQAPVSGIAFVTGERVLWTLAVVYGLLQIAYLARRWWREETDWGRRLKRGAGVAETTPADLP